MNEENTTDSVGKDDWLPNREIILHWQKFAKKLADKLGCISIDTEIVKAVDKLLAATPSGGGEWTEKFVREILRGKGADGLAELHNATLQPRDCGEDTKRLDWLEVTDEWEMDRRYKFVQFNSSNTANGPRMQTVREAIDAAMSETRRGEKSQP